MLVANRAYGADTWCRCPYSGSILAVIGLEVLVGMLAIRDGPWWVAPRPAHGPGW